MAYSQKAIADSPSIEEQHVAIEGWCAKNGLPVGLWIDDDRRLAARFNGRKQLASAIGLAAAWNVPLVVHSLDVAIGSLAEFEQVVKYAKAGFVAVADKFVDTTHDAGEVVISLIRLGANLGLYCRKSHRKLHQYNKPVYGWRNRAIHWPEQHWRRAIWKRYADGWTTGKLKKWLVESKAPPPQGLDWTLTVVRGILVGRFPVVRDGEDSGEYRWKAKRKLTPRSVRRGVSELDSISAEPQ